MIIVPELQAVFILVPRTGSGTLYRELQRVYPKSMLLYRHMEADGIPHGYDRWRRIGFVRHPLMRLWSLYNYMRTHKDGATTNDPIEAQRVRSQSDIPFEQWMLTNNEPFTKAFNLSGTGRYSPLLMRSHAAPENKLSQHDYLRPDLGTEIHDFKALPARMADWGLNPRRIINNVPKEAPPQSAAITAHLWKFCTWDMEQNCEYV